MATPFNQIIDIGLIEIDDYKLQKLYALSEDEFNTYCDGFLVRAISDFTDCRKPLDYDVEKREILADLDYQEIDILADLFAISWWNREVQNSAQIALKMKTNAVQFNSEANNLKEKSTYLDKLREKVSQRMTEYQLKYVDEYDWEG